MKKVILGSILIFKTSLGMTTPPTNSVVEMIEGCIADKGGTSGGQIIIKVGQIYITSYTNSSGVGFKNDLRFSKDINGNYYLSYDLREDYSAAKKCTHIYELSDKYLLGCGYIGSDCPPRKFGICAGWTSDDNWVSQIEKSALDYLDSDKVDISKWPNCY